MLLTSETSGSVYLRGMSMCDAGYSGRTVKIVKELREKFDLARSDHNSPFAHHVCCMDPLRLTLHKIYAQHVPTKLTRVDKILSKYEGHGLRLLCSLICKYNLSLVGLYFPCLKESLRVSRSVRDPVSLSLSCSRPDENDSTEERCRVDTHVVVSGGKTLPSLLVDYGSTTLVK